MEFFLPFVLILVILMSGCGYVPVRTPFKISGGSYQGQAFKKDRIRLLVWNIHKEVNKDIWKDDFIRMVKNTKQPDIVLLQEVRLDLNIIEVFKNDLGMGWEFAPNLYQDEFDAYSGILTASYIQPTFVSPVISNGTEPFSNTPKSTLFTEFQSEISSVNFLIVNIHGINFKIGLSEFKEQMRYVMDVIALHDGPVILAGDFNTWSEKRLKHLRMIADKAGLKEIDFEKKSKHISTMFGNPLDHIFISKKRLRIIKNSIDVIVDKKSSDHNPLFIELEFLK